MDIVERLRDRAKFDRPIAPEKLMVEAADEIEQLRHVLNQSLGIIVEFGNLNGFRNLSDAELGRAVVGMAERIAEVLPERD